MLRKPAILVALLILTTIALSVWKHQPPLVVPATAPATVFSAERAFTHLQQIAREPHSIGTPGHARVRQYIVNHMQQLGLETSVQQSTAIGSFRSSTTLFAGRVQNVIARLKGRSGSGKAVVVAAHYDSQPNTPGAGDDGSGVAAMLEVARMLKGSAPLANDIIFLFTDGEEVGLLGAKAFIEDSSLLAGVGLVLNFEARGSRGISHMFEVNSENGWMMRHFVRAAAHPFANSLNYEVYKLLPNDTDFSLFKRAGIAGLNHAFIEGLEDYHSMTDSPEHLDKRSLQHHGANMLSLVREFGNTPLNQTRGSDLTYFNAIGSVIIAYPAALNPVLTFLAVALLGFYLFTGIRRKEFSPKSVGLGALVFLLVLGLLYMGAWVWQRVILSIYPLNERFYENNAYNSSLFFLAVTLLSTALFSAVLQLAVRQLNTRGLFAGIAFVWLLFTVALQLLMPTGSYLFYWPLIFSLSGALLAKQTREGAGNVRSFLFTIPLLLLFTPVISSIFVAFGMGTLMPAATILIGLGLGLLLPAMESLYRQQRWLVPGLSFTAFLAVMLIAHLNSSFTADKPLQTNLWYRLDADNGKAQWASTFERTDYFNRKYLDGGQTGDQWPAAIEKDAQAISIPSPSVQIQWDSTPGESRNLSFRVLSPRGANSITLSIQSGGTITGLAVDGKGISLNESGSLYTLHYYGLSPEGFGIDLTTTKGSAITITATDRSLGLPALEGANAYPSNIIPGEGRSSNTTQVKKRFEFQ
jgi:hypothetical protein